MTTNTTVRIIPTRRRTPIDSAVVPKSGTIAQFRTKCSSCNLRELCVSCCGLTRSEMDVANRLVFNRSRVRRGERLYSIGDRFTSLYTVRNGFFKSTARLENGRDQVTGFSMPGEVLGTDDIGQERHTCNVIALENSDVCAIPFTGLQKLAQKIPSLQRQVLKMMSREIVREHEMILLLGSMNAEQRLAVFLLNLSQRFAAFGHSPSEVNLRMTRMEIGSYLGLNLATVSRTFSILQEQRLIGVRWRSVRILNSTGLGRLMGRKLD
jgi:CRP/FNR family transcriptional regulator, anaerobic regulatory protein